jgi:hypothetical protein
MLAMPGEEEVLCFAKPSGSARRWSTRSASRHISFSERSCYPDLFLRGGSAYGREHREDTRRPIGWEGP